MPEIQSGKDKIQKICEALKAQTIEPAKQEAKELLENAHIEAQEIKLKAKEEAAEIKKAALLEIEKQKKIGESALTLAIRQAVDTLKEEIEKKFFRENLGVLLEKTLVEPRLLAGLIEVMIRAIEKEGTGVDLTAAIAKSVEPRKISELIAKDVLTKLKEKGPVVGDFLGGVKIQLKDRNLTLDMSDKAIKELLAEYIRQDFRTLVFGG